MPDHVHDWSVFVINPKVELRLYRVLFAGGRTMDVQSVNHMLNSTDRGLVLEEAARRWGGKAGTKDKVGDWIIEGVAEVREGTDD